MRLRRGGIRVDWQGPRSAGVWQAPAVVGESRSGGELHVVLIGRLRDVVEGKPATEAELRKLREQADAWARLLERKLDASERRLDELISEPAPRLAEVSTELRRLDAVRPRLKEVRALLADLDRRARELRAAWVRASLADDAGRQS